MNESPSIAAAHDMFRTGRHPLEPADFFERLVRTRRRTGRADTAAPAPAPPDGPMDLGPPATPPSAPR